MVTVTETADVRSRKRSGAGNADTARPIAVDKILLADPRSFCAGVEMAIKALVWMVREFEPPVYCYHQIVHNRLVVERFEQAGVVFVDEIDDVPAGAPLMLSAHGTAPEVVADAHRHGRFVVNAACPLVTKVHHEVKVRAGKGYTVTYAGHGAHEEAVGTLAVAPDAIRLVESVADVDALEDIEGPVAFLTQTTLSLFEWQEIYEAARRRFPDIWMPGRSDLCFASTNRQSAVKAIAARTDAVVVVGSANSSNTLSLVSVARASGCPRVLRVDRPDELPSDLRGTVGVTSGASAPDEAVQAVLDHLSAVLGVEVVKTAEEEEYFPPPAELREYLKAVGLSSEAEERLRNDRTVTASALLAALP